MCCDSTYKFMSRQPAELLREVRTGQHKCRCDCQLVAEQATRDAAQRNATTAAMVDAAAPKASNLHTV